MVPIDRTGAQEIEVIVHRPDEITARFFREGVRPRINGRVQSEVAWRAYKQWCINRDLPHVSHTMFGKLARWPKERRGNVWYVGCEHVEERAKLPPPAKPKARLGTMAESTAQEPVEVERG
ncbi:MAG TPA: hypothetical protein VH913_01875 [Hyphomicrobiaceae bacterium]